MPLIHAAVVSLHRPPSQVRLHVQGFEHTGRLSYDGRRQVGAPPAVPRCSRSCAAHTHVNGTGHGRELGCGEVLA